MIERESEILKTLDFSVRKPTVIDFLTIYIEYALKPTLSIIHMADDFELIEQLSIYLSKMVFHDYELSQL